MKKYNKSQISLFFIAFILIVAISVAAYSGMFSKDNSTKVFPSKLRPGKTDNGGPIQFSSMLDNNYYYDNNNVYLYINLKTGVAENVKERSPLNIAIVIDKSGSMADKKKLEYVKKSVDYIIDQLGRDDYVSVVTYDDYVSVLQRSELVNDKYDLRDKISKIQAGGYTNLSEGMFEGYDQVNRTYARGYVNRVLLLTDGLANKGVTDRYKLADMVRDKNRRDGITISTFGVGNDFNENLMADIADYGKGNYYYINNSEDIPGIFAQELKGINNLMGQGTKVKVKFPTKYLALSKVFGYPYDVSGDEITVDLKDVFAEQDKSILIKFNVVKKIDSRLNFESELTYEDVNSDFKIIRETTDNSVEPANNRDLYTKSSNETVAQNISVFEANDIMEQALREADNGNYDIAREKLKAGQDYMSGQMNQVVPSPEMRRQQGNMDKYGKDLESAETKTEDEKKEIQKSGKYDNYNSRKNK